MCENSFSCNVYFFVLRLLDRISHVRSPTKLQSMPDIKERHSTYMVTIIYLFCGDVRYDSVF